MNEGRFTNRLVFVGLLLMFAVTGLAARLGVLHLGVESVEQGKVDGARKIKKPLPAERGRIVDGSGTPNLLALNLAVKDIAVDPLMVASNGSVSEAAEKLAVPLAMPAEELLARMSDCRGHFAYLKRWVPEEDAERVRQLKLPGIILQENTLRFYPQRMLLCHVLGHVSLDNVGCAGIEQVFDEHLRGSSGYLECSVNAMPCAGVKNERPGRRNLSITFITASGFTSAI